MSLFNPYVLLGVVLAVLSSFGSGYYKGKHDENTQQQLEIARLNEEARQKEQALSAAVNTTANSLRVSNEKAKSISKERDAAIASGALKLRVPIQAPVCPVHTATDATVAPRDSVQANAELDRETAKSLVAITDDGDKAIRQLNACIDAYNTAFQTINQRSK
jgi:flagellar capping protein FliD